MNIEELQTGMFRELSSSFSAKDVFLFAELSKDHNPVHLDETFAASTIFKKPIVHGMLVSSLISALIANHLPGNGSIYKNQVLNFIRPVYYGEEITARVTVQKVVVEKGIVELETIVYKGGDVDQMVINGNAVIKKLPQ